MESWGDPDGGAVRRLTPEQEEEEAPRRTWSVVFRMNGVGSDVEVSSMTWEPRQYHIMYYREELEATGWLMLTGGSIARPEQSTCNSRTIDLFVVSRELAHTIHSVSSIRNIVFSFLPIIALLQKTDDSYLY